MSKVILYPGSFDPIHIGHLNVMYDAYKTIKPNTIRFIVQPNIFKYGGMFTIGSRIGFINILISDDNRYNKIHAIIDAPDDFKYFYDYLEVLMADGVDDEFYLLIGDDTLETINKWKNFDKLIKKVKFIVHHRKYTKDVIESKLKDFGITGSVILDNTCNDISSSIIRRDIYDMVMQYR